MSNSDNYSISKYYKSFSGTDALVFALLPESTPVVLGTITTISYSMFRDKKPVPLIGKINVGGFTRGTRIYAGTMIFTIINQHWVNDLMEQAPWLKEYGRLKADELPLFDLMIVCANEYGASVQMFIYGVDITDEGQVISIEDILTENTFSFVARDLTTFTNTSDYKQTFSTSRTIKAVTAFSVKYSKDLNAENLLGNNNGLQRNISYNTQDMATGNDVIKIQQLLNNTKVVSLPITGIYDTATFEAVKAVQSSSGLKITGAIDDITYDKLKELSGDTEGNYTTNTKGLVINKAGAIVYIQPNVDSDKVTNYNYKDNIDVTQYNDDWYCTDEGYVSTYDVYTYLNPSSCSFAEIHYKDKGANIVIAQDAINSMVDENKQIQVTGEMDSDTVNIVKEIQSKYGLATDGIINKDLWLILQENANLEYKPQYNGVKFIFSSPPRTYKLTNVSTEILKSYSIKCETAQAPAQIKVTAIAHYGNNKIKEFIKTLQIQVNSEVSIDPSFINDAFIYNPDYGSTPLSVEFIIYSSNSTPYKWIFNL